jgi:2'-5' RNA ligase
MGQSDFDWLDKLRQQHFPPDRSVLRAHLTLFHHLAPSLEVEVCQRLKSLAQSPVPAARVAGLINLGRGVAYRIESAALLEIRADLAGAFDRMLTPQDAAPWQPHVTIQNKVDPAEARTLLNQLSTDFRPRPLVIIGLGLWRYLGGPWEAVGAWRFGAGQRMTPPSPIRC